MARIRRRWRDAGFADGGVRQRLLLYAVNSLLFTRIAP